MNAVITILRLFAFSFVAFVLIGLIFYELKKIEENETNRND